MTRPTTGTTSIERLVLRLLDGVDDDVLAGELLAWAAGSGRFEAFLVAHAAKIHKKLRTAADAEARRDVRAELRLAHQLLADRRFELAFEAYGSGRRGPDFTVTFRDTARFNLELTRLRRSPGGTRDGGWLLAKLRQLPPSIPNAIVVAIDAAPAEALDVDAAVRGLRARADSRDDAFFTRRGLDGSRGFHERIPRLGGVFTWSERAKGDARAALWIHRSARIALPSRAATACLDGLRADA